MERLQSRQRIIIFGKIILMLREQFFFFFNLFIIFFFSENSSEWSKTRGGREMHAMEMDRTVKM